jgi:hypothetical protein
MGVGDSERPVVKKWVSKFPLLSTLLLEIANISQLVRMWTEHSALGQSLLGWAAVWCALVLWYTYYKVMLPTEKIPRYCQFVGILMNSAVICTVTYFRYYAA